MPRNDAMIAEHQRLVGLYCAQPQLFPNLPGDGERFMEIIIDGVNKGLNKINWKECSSRPDAEQEAFEKILRALSEGKWRAESCLDNWAATIAYRTGLVLLEHEGREPASQGIPIAYSNTKQEHDEKTIDPETLMGSRSPEQNRHSPDSIHAFVEGLPASLQQIVQLFLTGEAQSITGAADIMRKRGVKTYPKRVSEELQTLQSLFEDIYDSLCASRNQDSPGLIKSHKLSNNGQLRFGNYEHFEEITVTPHIIASLHDSSYQNRTY